jgi:hypothetical protein
MSISASCTCAAEKYLDCLCFDQLPSIDFPVTHMQRGCVTLISKGRHLQLTPSLISAVRSDKHHIIASHFETVQLALL